MVFIRISLTTNDAEHLLVRSFAVHLALLGKYLLESFPTLNWFVFFVEF